MAVKFRNPITIAALVVCATAAGASEWDDLLPDGLSRGFLFCVAGGFSANRYVAYAAWEIEQTGVVHLAVRKVSWDGVEDSQLSYTDCVRSFDEVIQVLIENGVWGLGDAAPVYDLGARPLDLPTYHITIVEERRRHSFAVYDPLAVSEDSYLLIVQTLQKYFTDLGL